MNLVEKHVGCWFLGVFVTVLALSFAGCRTVAPGLVKGSRLPWRSVCELTHGAQNPRNSEGAFIGTDDGRILYAYSRYWSERAEGDWHDHAQCDIAVIESRDDGESWGAPRVIARGSDFGVRNVMSVSWARHTDGSLGCYFIVKMPSESGLTSCLGRAVTRDGGATFTVDRPVFTAPSGYYVFNNDRLERFRDGRLVYPAALCFERTKAPSVSLCFVSKDDGASFALQPARAELGYANCRSGLQEPGIAELDDGRAWMWMRCDLGRQYEAYSVDGFATFSRPEPSVFCSPCSPLEVLRLHDGTYVAAYNPVPQYDFRGDVADRTPGRTPFVLRRGTSGPMGLTWAAAKILEDDPSHAYCYPSMFETRDGGLLVAYCCGAAAQWGLLDTRIAKLKLTDL